MKTVSEIKKILIEHGISTSTPNMTGDDRLEALSNRLEKHLKKNGKPSYTSNQSSPLKLSSPIAPPPIRSPPKVTQDTLEVFNELTMAELRSRLAALGENTTTPGLNGEERRIALIKRLTNAVCGENGSESEGEVEVVKNPSPKREKYNDMPASVYGISKDTTSTDAAKMQQHAYENDDISEEIFEQALADVVGEEQFEILEEPIISNPSEMNIETVTEAQISDLKNRLKKIGNRRAMAIASKLSSGGNHQDQRLREAEKHLTKIDIEIKRIENISARSTAVSNSNTSSKGTSKMKNNKVNPSLQADLHNATSMLVDSGMVTYPIAELKELLKEMKEEAKADIKQHRLRIREEATHDKEFGVEAEKQMQSFLAEVNLSKGRNRRKVEQSKTLNCKANPISSSIDTPSATISKEDISPKTSSNVPTNLEVAPKQSIESNVGGLDSTKSKYPKPSMPPPREQESLKASKSSSEDPIPRPSSVKDSRRPQSSTQAYRIYEDDSEESEEESDSDSAMGTEEQEEVDIPVPNLYAPPSEPPPVLVTAPLAIVDGKDEVPDALLAHASGNAEIGECADSIESDANSEFFAREIKDLQDRSKTLQDILIKTEGSLASTSVEVPSISPSHPYVKYAPKPPGASGPPAVAPESMSPNAYTHFQLDAGSVDTTYRPETIQLSPRHAPDYLSEDDEEEVESDDEQETATVDFGAKDHKKEEELTEVSNPSADSNPLESSGNKTSTKVSQGADPVAVNYSLDEIDSDDSDDESEEENSNSNSAPILSEAVAIKPINSVSPGETLVVPSTPLGVVQERHDGYDTPPCTSGDMQNFGPSSGDGFKSTLSTPRTARGLLASVAAVKDVLRQAKRCQHKNDMVETEKLFTKALDMDPTYVLTLSQYATFLHRKKGGDMQRAEAFYKRAMQLCVPDLLTTLEGSPKKLEKPPIGVIHPESGEFYVPEVQSPQSMLVSTVAASSPTVGSSTKNTRSSALKPPQKHSDPPLAVAAAQAKAVSIGPPPMRPFSAAGVTTSVSPAGLSSPTTSKTKLTHVISLLLHYATFLTRAKGDIEAAGVVYAKAMEIDPNNVQLLVQFGHFLAEEENKGKKAIAYRLREREAKRQWLEDNSEDEDSDEEMAPLQDPMCHRNTNLGLHITRGWTVDQLYGMALKLDPTNAVATLGYAKYLRKCHKMAQAEVMYSAAYKLSASSVTTTSSDSLSKAKNHKFAPMAMCNYATFLYQHHGKVKRNLTASGMRDGESTAEQDKQISEADNGIRMAKILFEGGICKYPHHRGLLKNYKIFMQEIGRDVDTSLPLDDDQNSILMDTGLLSNFSTSLYPVEESNDVLNEENSGNGSLSTGVEWIMDGGKQHIIERNADEPIGSEAGFHVGASDACDYFEDYPNQYAEDSNNYGLSDIYARFAPIPED